MESTTKNRQSDAVLRTLIARAFGDDEVPTADGFAEEITEGWFNVLYRIRLCSGRRTVLKIAPPADVPVLTREIDMMRAELEAMRLISDRTAVPVPEILHVDLSREIVDADLFFMEHIDADSFGFTADAGGLPPEVVAQARSSAGQRRRPARCSTATPTPSMRTGADPGIAVFGREQLDVIMRALGAA